MNPQWLGLALAAYALTTVFYGLYLITQKRPFLMIGRGLVGCGFVLQTIFFVTLNHARGHWGVFGMGESLAFFSWLLILGLFILGYRIKIQILGCLLPPLAFAFGISALGSMSRQAAAAEPLKSGWFPVHVFTAFLGEAFFALTAILAVLYLLQERQLKSRRPGFLFYRLPPLEALDRLIDNVLKWGFWFLTVGMLSGAIWAHTALGVRWTIDPKQFWAVITWVLYALMIYLRLQHRLSGRRGAVVALLGSVVVLFTFIGTNLIYGESHYLWKSLG